MRAQAAEGEERALDVRNGDALLVELERCELTLLWCGSVAHRHELGATRSQRTLTIFQPSRVRASWR